MSISFITDDLAVTGRLSKDQIGILNGYGITCIINVGWPNEPDPADIQEQFCYLDLSIDDDGQPKPKSGLTLGSSSIRLDSRVRKF